ncbi:hypothetical protein GCM10009821_18310 [Aeromicrobium halocynthiae]|uniref:Uncharacterized protein n=1 Tax=Aeromicrobium halocynthiae TaxID=560557 RepID=A0ABN2W3I9_9ACTN
MGRGSVRRLQLTVVGASVAGVAFITVGAWIVLTPPIDWNRGGPIGPLIVGPLLLGLAVEEAFRLRREGPPAPGRRRRED